MDLRQHNDRNFIWHILAKGPKGTTTPYDLTGKDLLVEIEINRRTVITIDDFEVDGNTLSFIWYGKDQVVTGPFRIILTENPGDVGMHQIDEVGPFRLVASNAEIRTRTCPPNIEIESIELTSVVAVFDDSSIPVTVARKTWVNGVLEENYYNRSALDLLLADKQAKLISGQSIRKFAGQDLLGQGDMVIDGQSLNSTGFQVLFKTNVLEHAFSAIICCPNAATTALLVSGGNGSAVLLDFNDKVRFARVLSREEFLNNIGIEFQFSDIGLNYRVFVLPISGDLPRSAIQIASGASFPDDGSDIPVRKYYSKPSSGIPASDLATAVQDKLNAAGTALQPADILTLTQKVDALESLISEDADPTAAIDKFNEIVAFLANITNTETLAGIVAGINQAISAKYSKPAGGIPKEHLSDAVQASLEKADNSLRQLSVKEDKANKTTVLDANSTNDQYPSAKTVYDAIDPACPSEQPVTGMLPNLLYEFGELAGDTTFLLNTTDVARGVNHYFWTFETPSTAPTITWPAGITWQGGIAPTISANKHYEISVLNGIAVALEV